MSAFTERLVGALLAAALMVVVVFIFWKLGHPYVALMLLVATLQHLSDWVCTAAGIGVFRFKQDAALHHPSASGE
jgi:hypothetical protein